MAVRVGYFGSGKAREKYFTAYRAAEAQYPVPWRDLEVGTSFGPTYVRRSGTAPGTPLVLIHGFQGNSLAWHPMIAHLAQRRTVYLPDVIGTPGRSVQTEPITGGADLARWLGEVLTGLEVDRAHLVAFSHGGRLAGLLAGRSDVPVTLTLVEPGSVLVQVRLAAVTRMIWAGLDPTPRRLRTLLEHLQPGTPISDLDVELASTAGAYRMALPYARTLTDADLAAISTPTLVLCAADTALYDPTAAIRRARLTIPKVQTEIYPEVSHGILTEIPKTVVTRILQFTNRFEVQKGARRS